MSQLLDINGGKYNYVLNYRENKQLRNSLNNLTRKTFGFDFEQWYQDGYWKESYIPYSLLNRNSVVANVSVNIIDFLVQGEQKRYIQFGTVMTDKAYRGQGLSRALIERILDEWEDKCDLIYLFANASVLDFYPKFGFFPVNEYQCSIAVRKKDKSSIVRKLDVSNEEDRNLLYHKASHTLPFSKVSMQNNASLIMFYCISFMKESIYYINSYDTVVIADFDSETLYLKDIFSTRDIQLDSIIDAVSNEQTTRVVLGFIPNDAFAFKRELINEEDSTLFIKAVKENPFKSSQLMFPILSHA